MSRPKQHAADPGMNPLFDPGMNPLFDLGMNPLFDPGINPLFLVRAFLYFCCLAANLDRQSTSISRDCHREPKRGGVFGPVFGSPSKKKVIGFDQGAGDLWADPTELTELSTTRYPVAYIVMASTTRHPVGLYSLWPQPPGTPWAYIIYGLNHEAPRGPI